MRRSGVVVLAALLAFLGMLAPPAQAQAPTPKVSLGGVFEVITSSHWNLSQVDSDFTRASDSWWSTRQRTVLVTLAEVDKARGVLALELDLGWGMTGPGGTGVVPAAAPQWAFSSGTNMGASNDTMNVFEIKQLYVEFPVPLIPWPTTLRIGGQPGAGTAQYKPVLFFDDYPGVYFNTTFTPAVKLHFLYAQHDEDAMGCPKPWTRLEARHAGSCGTQVNSLANLGTIPTGGAIRSTFNRGDDYVIGASLDTTPMKGLDVRPFYLYWIQKGVFQNSQNTQLPTSGVGGIGTAAAFGSNQAKVELHYLGLDSRWRSGPFSFDPTVIWLLGQKDLSCAGVALSAGGCTAAALSTGQGVSAWMVDLRGGWRIGPLNLEGFALYASGNDARDNLGNTAGTLAKQNYFHPINTGGGYGAGWTNFLGSNSIDYIRGFSGPGTSMNRGSFISFDRYGAAVIALRPSYALTNALTLQALAAANWTAEAVDTRGVFTAAAGHIPETQGSRNNADDNFLGWELATNLVWAFAPGLTFDAMVGHLFAGDALNQCKTAMGANGVAGQCQAGSRDARDATSVAARVRFAF